MASQIVFALERTGRAEALYTFTLYVGTRPSEGLIRSSPIASD
jgi:hypothetical protein